MKDGIVLNSTKVLHMWDILGNGDESECIDIDPATLYSLQPTY